MASDTSIIEYEGNLVRKTLKPKKMKYKNLVAKEVEALKKLKGTTIAPELIDYGGSWILMTYVGKRITKETLPKNWKHQIDNISLVLKSIGISHNDIQCEELLVLDGRLHVIDFQHWTKTREDFEKLIKEGKTTCDWRMNDELSLLRCVKKCLPQ